MVSRDMLEYIVVGIILFILVNFICNKVRLVINLIRQRNARNNIGQDYHNRANTPSAPYRTPFQQQARFQGSRPLPDNRQNITRPARYHSTRSRQPLPRMAVSGQRDIGSYPRCPQCRCSNRPGMQQLVFMEGQNRWRCHRGHHFSS